MILDFERCYRAVCSRDARFDGWFFTGVTSTGIYCRPSCPAMTPKPKNVRFFRSAAAAQQAGLRACLRCRPDATPGSPEWNGRADAVARAMQLITDGVVDREGVHGLAARLGYGPRQLHRLLVAEVGTGALPLARAQRARTARLLIETTTVPLAQVAFAAGFTSVRQFNDTVRSVFALTPGELRTRAAKGGTRQDDPPVDPGAISLRLARRQPFAGAEVLEFLGSRAVPGIESYEDGAYARSLRLPHGDGVVRLSLEDGHVRASLLLDDLRDLTTAVSRCRRLLDLDADPTAVDEQLGRDPMLSGLVTAVPGRRVAGTVDGAELAVRAVLGQQVSVAGARTVAGRLVGQIGRPLAHPVGSVTATFPSPEAIVADGAGALAMPTSRRAAIVAVAAALAEGAIDVEPGAEPGELRHGLLALPGIGPWTTEYVVLRALGDPDAFLPSDLGILRALAQLGGPGTAAGATGLAEGWRPWRAYAMAHLWAVPISRTTTTTKGKAA